MLSIIKEILYVPQEIFEALYKLIKGAFFTDWKHPLPSKEEQEKIHKEQLRDSNLDK